MWTIRISGSGIYGVMVQARSDVGISRVQFASGSAASRAVPTAGAENVATLRISGAVHGLRGSLVSGELRTIAELRLERGDEPGSYVARFTPPTQGFRVLIAGTDLGGLTLQRLHAPLLTAVR